MKWARMHGFNNERDVLEALCCYAYFRLMIDIIEDPPSVVLRCLDDDIACIGPEMSQRLQCQICSSKSSLSARRT